MIFAVFDVTTCSDSYNESLHVTVNVYINYYFSYLYLLLLLQKLPTYAVWYLDFSHTTLV